jgi:predicted small metal-binding protein
MDKVLKCGDLFPGCAVEAHGQTEEDVLRQAAEHARDTHGLERIDEATLSKVRAAIRSEA